MGHTTLRRDEPNAAVPPGVDQGALPEIIGGSPKIRALRDQVERLLRPGRSIRRLPPVLLLGETGTGKGLLARAIHDASARRTEPFVAVNCAAIPESLLEGELFGFERGAFTDARQAKPGLFQTAHRGTLFLDEIGALPLGLQAKLLTALEDRTVRRLGSLHGETVDIWALTATSEPLPVAVRERRFREDLFHRIAAITLTLPPLREREGDVLELAEHFLHEACQDYGIPAKRLSPEACAALLGYSWPGNVRELANVMARVAILCEDRVVPTGMLELPGAPPALEPPPRSSPASMYRSLLDDFERSQLIAALESAGWNTSRAASALGIARNTLRYRISKHNLRPPAPGPRRLTPRVLSFPQESDAASVLDHRPSPGVRLTQSL
jgi:transcriptional regulator with PAS, ATPase and Fis domain